MLVLLVGGGWKAGVSGIGGSGKLQLRLDVQARHLDERMTWSWIELGIGVMAFSELGLTILFLSCFVVHSFVSWRSRLLREGWKGEA